VTAQVRARHDLECVNRDLEEFAYVAGHDLQEPLRMVNIYTQLLLKQFPASREAGTYSRFVREGVRRMDELIKDLLADSRVIHSEREEAQLADLNESLEKALSVLRMNIEDTGAIISRNPLPSVSGNTRQLALVFRNILSNALKYRQPDRVPRVEIAVEDAPDQWIISVRDNGIGLSRSMQSASSGFSNACTKTPIPAPVSDWQSVSASSSGTAAASGQPATGMGRAQSSRSPCSGPAHRFVWFKAAHALLQLAVRFQTFRTVVAAESQKERALVPIERLFRFPCQKQRQCGMHAHDIRSVQRLIHQHLSHA
jgi:hypothetical protein